MKAVECADYDSMGNHGRFPSKKIKKAEISIFEIFARYIKKIAS